MKFYFFLLLVCANYSVAFSQQNVYRDVDSLLKSNNILNKKAALLLLEKKYASDSTNSNYWVTLANAYKQNLKYSKILDCINKAIKINPKNDAAYFEKAQYYYNEDGNAQLAYNTMQEAIALAKKGEYYMYRGIYAQLLKKDQEAMDNYDKAVQLNYNNDGMYRNYAILLFNMDNPTKALTIINKAIAMEPNEPSNYITKAEAYGFLMDIEKMCNTFKIGIAKGYKKKNDFNEVVCKNTTEPNKFIILGDAFYLAGKYKFAAEAYTKALPNSITNYKIYLNRGACYYQLKDYKKAEKDLLHSLTLPSKDTDLIYDNLSLIFFDQNDLEKSIFYTNKRIELNKLNHIAYLDRGLCYRKLKKYEEAENDFAESLKLKPDYFRAYAHRAYMHLELKEYQKAYEDALKSIQFNAQYGYGYLVLGQAKLALKKANYCEDFLKAKEFGDKDADDAIKTYCK